MKTVQNLKTLRKQQIANIFLYRFGHLSKLFSNEVAVGSYHFKNTSKSEKGAIPGNSCTKFHKIFD